MSLRQSLAGVSGAVFVSVLLILNTPVSGADFTATQSGSMEITFSVPTTPEPPQPDPDPEPEPQPDSPDPQPNPQPEQPFDWNWQYSAPTCDGVTIAFPSNLPASQQGVMEVNVVGGSISGMQYKLEGQQYQVKYPNGHVGQTVVIPWSAFRNYSIPATGTWTVTQLQVHGTNYHWAGNVVCGSTPPEPRVVPKLVPPVVVPEPQPEVEPTPTPTPEPESTPGPPLVTTPPQPQPEPEPQPEESTQPPVETPPTSPEVLEPSSVDESFDQEGTPEV